MKKIMIAFMMILIVGCSVPKPIDFEAFKKVMDRHYLWTKDVDAEFFDMEEGYFETSIECAKLARNHDNQLLVLYVNTKQKEEALELYHEYQKRLEKESAKVLDTSSHSISYSLGNEIYHLSVREDTLIYCATGEDKINEGRTILEELGY